ncbi:thiamine phosphate synthase [Secundilactobacillus folii]|uniref:Thiamine-phosphate synthase n=1 Tax=Secundilactobacillus folii TaxID=2678357 RepID=A0A7X2XW06_9LACO|nr:thiamine phosphate synthase [Secundilactobacillus folii]MTV82718.1 thiamine phosphate synthase [Secundilactobacillus folii]
MKFKPEMLKAYFVCGSQDVPKGQLKPIVESAIKAGITAFQFRDKGSGSTLSMVDRAAVAMALRGRCAGAGIPFIVDDDVELAKQVNADGIHVGQSDEQIQRVVSEVGDQMMIGLSCSTASEIERANTIDGIDYYGSGPVHATGSKADADPVIGLAGLKQLVSLAKRPVVGIGGIAINDLSAVIATGAAGSAVISLIAQSDDIAGTVKAMLEA